MSEPFQFLLLGLGAGAIYALSALGIVATYRGSGVINFAHGAFGMAAAYVYYYVADEHGMGVWPGMIAGLATGALLGFLTSTLVMRPLQAASKLTQLIATLGIVTILQALFSILFPQETQIVQPFLGRSAVTIAGARIGVDRLVYLGVAVTLTVVLWAVYRFTMFGVRTSAVAENRRASAVLGHSPDRISAVNWTIGGLLAAAAGVLVAPLISINVTQLTLMMVPALAAAVVGNFQSFQLTLLAGLAVGVIQSELQRYVQSDTWRGLGNASPFILIVVAVVWRGRGLPDRSFVRLRFPSVGTGKVHPIALIVTLGIGLVVLGLVPTDWADSIGVTLCVAMVILSVVVVSGYAGQLSLAQVSLSGVGALIAARFVEAGFPFEVGLLAAMVLAAPIGVLIGSPALRVRGPMLAVVTLALAVAIDSIIFQNPGWAGGSGGLKVGQPTLFGITLDRIGHPVTYGAICLVAFVLLGILVANVRRGRAGRRLLAVRTNERAAAAMGVSVVGAKLYAFGLGSVVATVGGVLLAFRVPVIRFDVGYNAFRNVLVDSFAVIGGLGAIVGAWIGATFDAGALGTRIGGLFGDSATKWVLLIGGVIIVLQLIRSPDGIAITMARDFARMRSRFAPQGRGSADKPPVADVSAEPSVGASPTSSEPVAIPKRVRHGTGLVIEDLKVRFGAVVAVDDVSLHVAPGEIVGLIGPNGAGKTSLIDAVTGFVASTGSVTLNGRAIGQMSAFRRSRLGLARSFQSLELLEDLTVLENFLVASDSRDRWAYIKDAIHPGRPSLSVSAKAAIREFGLEEVLDSTPASLPYGQRRLVAVARAVASDPDIVLLDEPASGLDETATNELAELISDMARIRGSGVLLVEHDVDLVMRLCDRVVALDFGRVIASGTPSEVRSDHRVIEAYLGADTEPANEPERANERIAESEAVAR